MHVHDVAGGICQALDVGVSVRGTAARGHGVWFGPPGDDAGRGQGGAVQLEPMKCMLKAPGTKRLELKSDDYCEVLLSISVAPLH